MVCHRHITIIIRAICDKISKALNIYHIISSRCQYFFVSIIIRIMNLIMNSLNALLKFQAFYQLRSQWHSQDSGIGEHFNIFQLKILDKQKRVVISNALKSVLWSMLLDLILLPTAQRFE